MEWVGEWIIAPLLAMALCLGLHAANPSGENPGLENEVSPIDFSAGGWSLDAQFTDTVGSPYLLAHGMGRPVPDATANVTLPEAGAWRVRVRTRNWAAGSPGRFAVLIDGKPLTKTFGAAQRTWDWEDGGEVEIRTRQVRVTLRDLTGFDGRCAGLVFERGDDVGRKTGAIFPSDRLPTVTNAFQLVVVGGGMPGTCAAIAAARAGVRTALVQDRPVLGGNGSAEIRVYCAGEVRHPLVEEIKGSFMNRDENMALQDRDRLRIAEREPNLSLFLEHRVFAAERDGERLRRAKAIDLRTGRVVAFDGELFCDATGDGWLGSYAGADWRMGREAKAEFGETMAPERADGDTLGSSVMWHSAEANRAVPFSAPWAESHAQGVVAVSGEWNWEYGIHRDICREGEEIRDRLLLAIYGSFSLAKKDPVNARRQIVFCPFLLGKRESRRLMGDYVYSEKDVTETRTFEDAVATGSWSVDLHYDDFKPGVDFLTTCRQPMFPRYWIPFRSLYSRNVSNLMMAGRCFSCTHVGLAGPRVISTLAQCGVAVGTAAGMCVRDGILPRDIVRRSKARELQRLIGGDWPGNPDPTRADWRIVDDADASVEWKGKWSTGCLNHNGGQHGRTFAWSGEKSVSARFPLPVERAGRYRLLAKTPWLHSTSRLKMTVDVLVTTPDRRHAFVWNQNAGNGDWYGLGEFDLKPGAAVTLNCIPDSPITADAFAVVPVKTKEVL